MGTYHLKMFTGFTNMEKKYFCSKIAYNLWGGRNVQTAHCKTRQMKGTAETCKAGWQSH